MAKQTLPVNYQDDIVSESMNGRRRYNMIQNPDGTVSLVDATEYDLVGTNLGAGQINAITQAVNDSADASKIIDDADDCSAVTENGFIAGAKALGQVNSNLGGLRFGKDGDGNYGYYGADGSLIPFKRGDLQLIYADFAQSTNNNGNLSLSWNHSVETKGKLLIHATCVHDANGGSNTIVATKNGVTLIPSQMLQAPDYSQPLTCIYEVDVEIDDELEVTATAVCTITGNAQAQRTYISISVYGV